VENFSKNKLLFCLKRREYISFTPLNQVFGEYVVKLYLKVPLGFCLSLFKKKTPQ